MIALYPGAFKPPHRGHFEVVKRLLKGNHGGHIYTKDSGAEAGAKALAGQKGKVEKITKVIVFPGGGERNGITKGESMAIWKIYAKYLPGIEVVDGEKNPMFAAKDYAAANEGEQFYAVTGIRDESDFADLKRITTFKNVNNVEGLLIPSAQGDGIRATDLRKAALEGNLDNLRDFFPEELNRQELLTVLKMLKDNVIAEIMNQKIEDLFEAMFTTEDIKEGSSGAPLGQNMPIRSEDRAKLITLYNRIRNQIETPGVKVVFNQDHIRVELENQAARSDFDFTPYMASILEYMIDEGMKITPLPEVKIKRDLAESEDFFGRTAYYDPNLKEVVLFVQGRHPKDVMRSFVHEMIHHIQNLEGRLGKIGTSNTNEDDHLLEIEKEAYLTGNITFRNWEDKVKNENKKEVVAEGKYDKISNQISSDLFNALKNGEESFYENYYNDNLDFDVYGTFVANEDEKYFSVDGDADYDETGEGNDSIQVIVSYNPKELPKAYKDISFTLKDIVRHEIEHLTHGDSDNLKPGKYIEDDSLVRKLIKTGVLPKGDYFKLAKEVDANIQGMYFRAKKEKRPFRDVVKQYFDDQDLPKKDYDEILDLMNKRLPALGIKQRL